MAVIDARLLAAELDRYRYAPEWEAVLRNYPWEEAVDWPSMAEADPMGWWRVAILQDGTVLALQGSGRRRRWAVFPPGADLHILLSGDVIDLSGLDPAGRALANRYRDVLSAGAVGAPLRLIRIDLCRRCLLREGQHVSKR
ncbi:MAG TPA: hypothetical protein VNT75_04995 [Symbiobacteriaceae bacterium]|nr:hypothetical protein [Symbiobacteriaceae bacterium]